LEDWLSKALDMVPELQGFLFEGHDFDNPISLWIDLFSLLMKAYRETPIDDDLAGRIYAYAAWCFEQPQTDDDPADISTAAAFCLIESIPLDQKISNDLHR
jgi:hypothetical protein